MKLLRFIEQQVDINLIILSRLKPWDVEMRAFVNGRLNTLHNITQLLREDLNDAGPI